MSMLQTQALLAVDRPVITSVLSIVRMVTTIAATVPLTLALGLTGTGLAAVIGCLVLLVSQFVVLRPHLSAPLHRFWPYRNIVVLLVAYAAGFASAHSVYSALGGAAGLLGALAAGSVAYIFCVILGGGVLQRDLARFSGLLGRLSRRRGLGTLATRLLRASARA
jgi:hypothetical protein